MAACHAGGGVAERQVVGMLTTADGGGLVAVAHLLVVVAYGGDFDR